MATTFQTIVDRARKRLREDSASFWTDAELLVFALAGASDLWKMVLDLHQEHYMEVDDSNVTLAANTGTLSGIPSTCFRVISIEARDLSTSSANFGLEFFARDWLHPDFVNARRQANIEPSGRQIFYKVVGQGPPVGTLTVRVAPKVTAAVNLTLTYLKTHGATALVDNNPIPGESDLAIEAWTVAHARAKEREDGSPDPAFLAIYKTEKDNLRVVLTPRTEEGDETAVGMYEGFY